MKETENLVPGTLLLSQGKTHAFLAENMNAKFGNFWGATCPQSHTARSVQGCETAEREEPPRLPPSGRCPPAQVSSEREPARGQADSAP